MSENIIQKSYINLLKAIKKVDKFDDKEELFNDNSENIINNFQNVNELNDLQNEINLRDRFVDKLFFEFSPQEILNIIEALHLYRELMLPKKYRFLIDEQLENITTMLSVQNIDTFKEDNEPEFKIGEKIKVDISIGINFNKETVVDGILLGAGDIENFFKVVVIDDNKFKIIEAPINLIRKE